MPYVPEGATGPIYMVKFRGWISYKQYMPKKLSKEDIKYGLEHTNLAMFVTFRYILGRKEIQWNIT
jgi:hypothetical protein